MNVDNYNLQDITILIIACNEINNIRYTVENVKCWAKEIIVLDSGSTDGTVEYLKKENCKVFYREFDNFSNQRKYLLNDLPVNSEWVFVLDADECLTEELKNEIKEEIKTPKHDAYWIKRKFYWMGKWVKRGYYPTELIRFGRYGKLDCDDRPVNEHIICKTDNVGRFTHDFIDENHNGLAAWFQKHNNYSDREAEVLFERDDAKYNLFGSQYERKRWIRVNIWNRLPVFVRPFLYLIYRLIIRLGILDGPRVALYHFLHAFIYRSMIDAKYLEKKWAKNRRLP